MRDVVNENDEVIGRATKEEIEKNQWICRVAFILLTDSAGNLILQQRSANKRAYPLYWSGSAAGHVNAGESYETAAQRELKEELDIETELRWVGRFYSPDDHEMVGVLVGPLTGEYKAEPAEVAAVATFSIDELNHRPESMKVTSFVDRAIALLNSGPTQSGSSR